MATRDFHRSATWTARALTYFVYAIVVINEIILVLGFTLLLFGANPTASFTQWAYRNLDRVMAPFRGIFTPIQIGAGGADVQPVLDTSILFAMLVYVIVGLALRALIDWFTYRLVKIDAQREQEEAEARMDAEALLRAQQIAAMNAASAAAPQPTSVPPAPGSGVPAPPVPPVPSVPPAPPGPGAP
jgi:YGGT family